MFLVINRSVLKEGNKIFLNDKNERIKITWQEVLKLSTEIKEIGKEKLCKVDLCLLTKETLSCIFLDALISATGIEKEQTKSIGSVLDKFKGKEKELIIELTALSQLLNSSERVKDEIMKQHNNGSNGLYYKDSNGYLIKKNQLVTDSAIYICWYSEIRELLFRKPDLSNQLEVFPLPGGGFKGDWHIGVLNGSVSANLGLNVIKKLCNKNEDYKRFALGVGLPTREEFYKKEKEKEEKIFYAWPYSNVELSEIKEIYDSANERADIDGYLEIKDQLVSMIHWLIQIENDNTGNCEEKIVKDIINRLKPIYDILKPE
jgi:peptidyl-tRNA hydrolase